MESIINQKSNFESDISRSANESNDEYNIRLAYTKYILQLYPTTTLSTAIVLGYANLNKIKYNVLYSAEIEQSLSLINQSLNQQLH